ncbi:hypothetical protein LMG29542_00100 [Paraburkholderia humisilvae]|uniref:Uncharacterized protein n=1 Tax=Paraburkholderia humisilvae TaxID=627669 RepID=A0A6J5CV53_9BURK|nr:hypothetical protein LMG29542_00100 [Paraburkholderia humisilvae]
MDSAALDYLTRQREVFAINAIAASPLNGQPAFLVYGRSHQFANHFSGEGAPALFRKVRSEELSQ